MTVKWRRNEIHLYARVICLPVRGKLQCQLILEHRRENSRYVPVGPTDASLVGSLHAKGDSSCVYDHNVLKKM